MSASPLTGPERQWRFECWPAVVREDFLRAVEWLLDAPVGTGEGTEASLATLMLCHPVTHFPCCLASRKWTGK